MMEGVKRGLEGKLRVRRGSRGGDKRRMGEGGEVRRQHDKVIDETGR